MKPWIDNFDLVYCFSPYEAFYHVRTPLTKILLLVGFFPWFAVWAIAAAMVGVVMLLHDVVLWIFDS